AAVYWPGKSGLVAATGESLTESLASAGLALGLLYAWPLILMVLLRVLRWRELLRAAGLAVLAVTTVRGLSAVVASLLAVWTAGATLAESKIWLLADPVDWAFIIAGWVLCVRAWHLATDASQILPEEAQVISVPRKLRSRGLLAMTGAYVLL